MKSIKSVHEFFGGQCRPGDVAPYVLVPGSEDRVEKFIEYWDEAHLVAHHYEFLLYTGVYKGVPISACSTGIGGMSVSIAVEELAKLGANTFLRVGVTSPVDHEIGLGELIIAKGAVRFDGTSHDYVRPEFPAAADFEVVMAAARAAERYDFNYQIGVIASMASLGPRRTDGYRKFLTEGSNHLREILKAAGVVDGEGESATLFILCKLYGFRAGTINVCSVDKETMRFDPKAEEKAIEVGLETIRILSAWDKIKSQQNRKFMTPGIIHP
jgi:uridine phosphorylase